MQATVLGFRSYGREKTRRPSSQPRQNAKISQTSSNRIEHEIWVAGRRRQHKYKLHGLQAKILETGVREYNSFQLRYYSQQVTPSPN
jgi:hypothetical protein